MRSLLAWSSHVRVLASALTHTDWVVVVLSAAIVVAALVYSFWRRSPRAPAASAEVTDLRYSLEALRRSENEKTELAQRLRLLERAAARSAEFERIGHALDLDSVLERSFEVSRAVLEIDAAAISVYQPRGEPVLVTFGFTQTEDAPIALQEPQPGTSALATTYHHAGAPAAGAIRAGLTLRLAADDAPLGLLALYWRDDRDSLETDDVELATELAAAVAAPIANGIRYRNALHQASMDGLTRLRHNSAFREALGAEVARARRYRRELSLLLLDIDDFKAVNDQIGHLAGDSVLSAFGARLANIARVADIPCRIGGDEFAVILPESGSADALRLFERLQAAGAGDVSVIAGPATFSGGVASWQFNEDPEPFFARADEALLEAKAAGKDRVVTSSLPGRSGSSVVPAGTGTQT